jgi:hypothetical protein
MPDIHDIYRTDLGKYREIDWYGFQDLEIAHRAYGFVKFLEERRTITGSQAKMLLRVMLEELYALISFQSMGCRVIRPSPALVHELLDTEVTFPLSDIRPPWPILYINLPRGCGVTVPHFHAQCPAGCDKKVTPADGFYVTWAETGEATRKAREDSSKLQEIGVDEKGEMTVRAMDALHGERLVKEADAFGDWFARFLAVACDDRSEDEHNWSVQYFNMHWKKESSEEAEGAFERFEGLYAGDNERAREPDAKEARNRLFHLAANLFLYMSMPQEEGDVVWKSNEARERFRTLKDRKSSKWRRNAGQRIYDEMPTEAWVVGQTVKVIDRTIAPGDTASGTSGERGSPKTHWRRAHWTTRWVGSRDGERKKLPRWIRATLVRGRGEAPESTTYMVGKERA